MDDVSLDFDWWRDEEGYEVVERRSTKEEGTTRAAGYVLQAKSKRWKSIRPLDFNPALFRDFAALPQDPEAYRAFANLFGLLGASSGPTAGASTPLQTEPISAWAESVTSMQNSIAQWQTLGVAFIDESGGWPVAKFDVAVHRRLPDGNPQFVLRPTSLYDALRAQFAGSLTSPADLHACECCGKWFSRGGGARRSDARFCSDLCRTRFNRGQCTRHLIDPFSGSGSLIHHILAQAGYKPATSDAVSSGRAKDKTAVQVLKKVVLGELPLKEGGVAPVLTEPPYQSRRDSRARRPNKRKP